MASVIVLTDTTPMAKGGEISNSGGIPAGQTATDTVQPVCELSVNQNPVGQGQYVLVNAWISPAVTGSRVLDHYVFTVTAPDGTNTTWNQDAEPATAATWFDYTLTQLGTYTFSAYETGCYFNGSDVAVGMFSSPTTSAYYLPASAKPINITCQANLVSSWPSDQNQALPTGYWVTTSRLRTPNLVASPRKLPSILRWNN